MSAHCFVSSDTPRLRSPLVFSRSGILSFSVEGRPFSFSRSRAREAAFMGEGFFQEATDTGWLLPKKSPFTLTLQWQTGDMEPDNVNWENAYTNLFWTVCVVVLWHLTDLTPSRLFAGPEKKKKRKRK